MKIFPLKLFFVVFLFSACRSSNEKEGIDTDTVLIQKPVEERFITVQTADSNTKQFINVTVHSDTTLMKALIYKLSKKDEKSLWDTISPFLIALLPILLGYFGYRYAIKQLIAKQRIDWINSFRPLAGKLISEIVKASVTFGEMYNLHQEFTNAQNEFKEAKKEVANYSGFKKPVKQELADRLAAAELRLNEKIKEKTEAEKQYKIDFFVMYQLLHEVIINLDTAEYPKQRELEQTIGEFQNSLDIDNDENPERISQRLIEMIREVIAEQKRLAEGQLLNSA